MLNRPVGCQVGAGVRLHWPPCPKSSILPTRTGFSFLRAPMETNDMRPAPRDWASQAHLGAGTHSLFG